MISLAHRRSRKKYLEKRERWLEKQKKQPKQTLRSKMKDRVREKAIYDPERNETVNYFYDQTSLAADITCIYFYNNY